MISVCTLSYFLVSAPSGMFFLNALHWAHFKLRNSVSDRATFEMGNKSLETRATTWQIQNDVWIIEKLETISASDWIPFTSSGQLWYVSKVWRILINRVTYYLQPLYSITHTLIYVLMPIHPLKPVDVPALHWDVAIPHSHGKTQYRNRQLR